MRILAKLPVRKLGLAAWLAAGIALSGLTGACGPAQEPETPLATPLPAATPAPLATPQPEATAAPAATLRPVATAAPTATTLPAATTAPTATAPPARTATPTAPPTPTATPAATPTAPPPTPTRTLVAATPTASPPLPPGSIAFTKRTNLDSVVPIPTGVYLDSCGGVQTYRNYQGFINPNPCGQNSRDIVYESEVQVLDDPLGTGRGRVLKQYAYPTKPNNGEHHGFLFASGPGEPLLCGTGDCWFGALFYFPISFPGGPGVSRMLIHGSQGTATAGPYLYLSPPKAGSREPTGLYNRIFFGNQDANVGIPIVTSKWIAIRLHAPAGVNRTATLWVTDLDGNPLVPGAATSLTSTYANIPGNVDRTKFGSDSEPDTIAATTPGFHWYQDNMYVAVQAANPGIWKE